MLAGSALAARAEPDAKALEQALDSQAEAVAAAVGSQSRVDETRERTAALLADYRGRSHELRSLERYHAHVERMLIAQQQAIAEAEAQLEAAAITERELLPLLQRMITGLRRFVELDLPFERAARLARVDALAALIDSPELTLAEKYRRILAAYRAELDAGRAIAAYRGPLPSPGVDDDPDGLQAHVADTVDLLRIGRVALFYRTLDGRGAGRWDHRRRRWVALSPRWRSTLDKALRIARKQAAPDLLTLPLPTPTPSADPRATSTP